MTFAAVELGHLHQIPQLDAHQRLEHVAVLVRVLCVPLQRRVLCLLPHLLALQLRPDLVLLLALALLQRLVRALQTLLQLRLRPGLGRDQVLRLHLHHLSQRAVFRVGHGRSQADQPHAPRLVEVQHRGQLVLQLAVVLHPHDLHRVARGEGELLPARQRQLGLHLIGIFFLFVYS